MKKMKKMKKMKMMKKLRRTKKLRTMRMTKGFHYYKRRPSIRRTKIYRRALVPKVARFYSAKGKGVYRRRVIIKNKKFVAKRVAKTLVVRAAAKAKIAVYVKAIRKVNFQIKRTKVTRKRVILKKRKVVLTRSIKKQRRVVFKCNRILIRYPKKMVIRVAIRTRPFIRKVKIAAAVKTTKKVRRTLHIKVKVPVVRRRVRITYKPRTYRKTRKIRTYRRGRTMRKGYAYGRTKVSYRKIEGMVIAKAKWVTQAKVLKIAIKKVNKAIKIAPAPKRRPLIKIKFGLVRSQRRIVKRIVIVNRKLRTVPRVVYNRIVIKAAPKIRFIVRKTKQVAVRKYVKIRVGMAKRTRQTKHYRRVRRVKYGRRYTTHKRFTRTRRVKGVRRVQKLVVNRARLVVQNKMYKIAVKTMNKKIRVSPPVKRAKIIWMKRRFVHKIKANHRRVIVINRKLRVVPKRIIRVAVIRAAPKIKRVVRMTKKVTFRKIAKPMRMIKVKIPARVMFKVSAKPIRTIKTYSRKGYGLRRRRVKVYHGRGRRVMRGRKIYAPRRIYVKRTSRRTVRKVAKMVAMKTAIKTKIFTLRFVVKKINRKIAVVPARKRIILNRKRVIIQRRIVKLNYKYKKVNRVLARVPKRVVIRVTMKMRPMLKTIIRRTVKKTTMRVQRKFKIKVRVSPKVVAVKIKKMGVKRYPRGRMLIKRKFHIRRKHFVPMKARTKIYRRKYAVGGYKARRTFRIRGRRGHKILRRRVVIKKQRKVAKLILKAAQVKTKIAVLIKAKRIITKKIAVAPARKRIVLIKKRKIISFHIRRNKKKLVVYKKIIRTIPRRVVIKVAIKIKPKVKAVIKRTKRVTAKKILIKYKIKTSSVRRRKTYRKKMYYGRKGRKTYRRRKYISRRRRGVIVPAKARKIVKIAAKTLILPIVKAKIAAKKAAIKIKKIDMQIKRKIKIMAKKLKYAPLKVQVKAKAKAKRLLIKLKVMKKKFAIKKKMVARKIKRRIILLKKKVNSIKNVKMRMKVIRKIKKLKARARVAIFRPMFKTLVLRKALKAPCCKKASIRTRITIKKQLKMVDIQIRTLIKKRNMITTKLIETGIIKC